MTSTTSTDRPRSVVLGEVEASILARLAAYHGVSRARVVDRLLRAEYARLGGPEVPRATPSDPHGLLSILELDASARMTSAVLRDTIGYRLTTPAERSEALRGLGARPVAMRDGARVVRGWAGVRLREP